ncbi:MAG: metallophosphoesterase [Bacteroides sp.]|nr:metallophosphoesterase [Bacteroides sp.]
MEILITLVILAVIEALLAILVCAVAMVSAMAGCSFRKVASTGLWLLILPPLFTIYGTFAERNIFRTVPVEIYSENIPESFDGYRIVHISDLHLSSFAGRKRQLEKAVQKINALKPDMIAMTGDLITFSPSEINGCDTILSRLSAADGVFSVLGNHDYCIYDRRSREKATPDIVRSVIAAEKAMGWNVLVNENVTIARGNGTISVIGVENTSSSPKFPSYGDLHLASSGADSRFKVLLSHDPTHWRMEVAGKSDIDLMLSGHTHDMQLSFFGWSPSSLIYDEHCGLYSYKKLTDSKDNILVSHTNKNVIKENSKKKGIAADKRQYLYVNIGLGETGFPARIGARPEITAITLRRIPAPRCRHQ